MKRLTRLLPPLLAFAFGAAAMLLFLQPAHADPLVTVTPTGLEVSWQGWLMAFVVVLGSALSILDTVLAALKRIAPMTRTTLDDRARDVVQVVDDAAHAKLDKLLSVVGGLIPATGVPTSASDKPALTLAPTPREKQIGLARLGTVVALALVGAALAGLALTGCTKAQVSGAATSAEHALVNCTGEAIGTTPALDFATLIAIAGQVGEIKAACTTGGAFDWGCAERAALAKGKTIGGCALAQLFANPPATGKPATSSVAVAPGQPDPGRAAFEDFRARAAGGATFHMATGDL